MTYSSEVNNLMQKVYSQITLQDNIDRKREMKKRIDYYNGEQDIYLKNLLDVQFKRPDRLKLQREFFNVTKSIIDEIAVIYSQPPLRELVDCTEKDKELFQKISEESQLDIVLDTVNKMTKLCKVVLVRPVVRELGKLEFDIITPDLFDVVQNMANPTKADAIIYNSEVKDSILIPQIMQTDDIYKRGKSKTKIVSTVSRDYMGQVIYYYWDSSKHFIFDGNGVPLQNEKNTEAINPYGEIPFIPFRDNYAISKYFDMSGKELIATNEIINVKLTELNYLTKMQAFSQPVRKGAGKDMDFVLDPSMCLDLPADDEGSKGIGFEFVTPEARIDELLKDIEKRMQRISMQHKLNPEMFKLSGDRSSGFSIQMQNHQLNKQINRDKPYYRAYEKQLFNIIKTVWNYEDGEKFSENCKLKVDYADVGAPTSLQETDNHNVILLQNGIITRAEWLIRANPDIGTMEEAEKRIKEIDEEKKKETQEEISNEAKKTVIKNMI